MLGDQQQRLLRGLPFGGGVRGILIYCSEDYHSHSICDQWRSEKALVRRRPRGCGVRLTAISPRETMFIDINLWCPFLEIHVVFGLRECLYLSLRRPFKVERGWKR
jgi:hypothetical protein